VAERSAELSRRDEVCVVVALMGLALTWVKARGAEGFDESKRYNKHRDQEFRDEKTDVLLERYTLKCGETATKYTE
jgi:hypothetical protein